LIAIFASDSIIAPLLLRFYIESVLSIPDLLALWGPSLSASSTACHHFQLIAKRVKMQGFLVNDYFGTPTEGAFAKDMPQWLKEGMIKYVEDIYEGLDSSAKAFIGLLKGHNVGKVIVHVADQ
jgi:NADPH-dependent curcumin reductase CurA